MTTPIALPSGYVHDNAWEHAGRRLQCLERIYDPASIRRLETIGVDPGARCLEVGAGAGSIARWLSAKVGPTGRVVAIDIDTRLLADLAEPNLEVMQLDLRTDALPPETFDLIHVRATLIHVPEREAVLDALVATLVPGGSILLEEVDGGATLGRWEGLHARAGHALAACLLDAGVDLVWGRDLPARLVARGLTDVGAGCEMPLDRGGAPGAELLSLTACQMRGSMLATGLAETDFDEWISALDDPIHWFPGFVVNAAWGRRP